MPRVRSAFTLSELLISLSVLGLISALTLPKIFLSVEEHRKRAVFKETYSVIQKLYSNNYANGYSYIRAKQLSTLNATQVCEGTAADNLVCETADTPGESSDANNQGFILPNGAHVWAISPDLKATDGLLIDWNGHAEPNKIGEDILYITVCIDPDNRHNSDGTVPKNCMERMGISHAGGIVASDKRGAHNSDLFNAMILNQ